MTHFFAAIQRLLEDDPRTHGQIYSINADGGKIVFCHPSLGAAPSYISVELHAESISWTVSPQQPPVERAVFPGPREPRRFTLSAYEACLDAVRKALGDPE